MIRFVDREDAGRRLADRLQGSLPVSVVVGAVPRGGLPVARPLADRLRAPLAIVPVGKLTSVVAPGLAFGAVDVDGEAILDPRIVASVGVSAGEREAERVRVRGSLRHAMTRYGIDAPALAFAGSTVVLVDDGAATGLTLAASVRYVRRHGATEVVVALPCAHSLAIARLEPRTDRLVGLWTDPDFVTVASCYRDYPDVTEAEVMLVLRETSTAESA